jgi:hypothetical protein
VKHHFAPRFYLAALKDAAAINSTLVFGTGL